MSYFYYLLFTIAVVIFQRRQWHPTPVLSPGKSMDRGGWWAVVHGVAKSRARPSNFTFTFHFHALEKEMQPTPVFLPGESQGRGAWWAAIYGVAQSWTRLKQLSSSSSSIVIFTISHTRKFIDNNKNKRVGITDSTLKS